MHDIKLFKSLSVYSVTLVKYTDLSLYYLYTQVYIVVVFEQLTVDENVSDKKTTALARLYS